MDNLIDLLNYDDDISSRTLPRSRENNDRESQIITEKETFEETEMIISIADLQFADTIRKLYFLMYHTTDNCYLRNDIYETQNTRNNKHSTRRKTRDIAMYDILQNIYKLITIKKYTITNILCKALFENADTGTLIQNIIEYGTYMREKNILIEYVLIYNWIRGVGSNLMDKTAVSLTKKNYFVQSIVLNGPNKNPFDQFVRKTILNYNKIWKWLPQNEVYLAMNTVISANINNYTLKIYRSNDYLQYLRICDDQDLNSSDAYSNVIGHVSTLVSMRKIFTNALFMLELKNREYCEFSNVYCCFQH